MNQFDPVAISATNPDEAKAFELAHAMHELISSLAPGRQPTAYGLFRLCAANPTRERMTALVDFLLPPSGNGSAA